MILYLPTCEPVFGVASVALHPGERQRRQVVDGPTHRRHGRVSAAQRPVCGDTDDPSGVHVSPIGIHAHVHVISPAEGGHSARAGGAVISAVTAREAAAAPAAVIGRLSVLRLVHPHAEHAALLHVTEDLINTEADWLQVRVVLQMRSQQPDVIHCSREPRAPARGTEVAPRAARWNIPFALLLPELRSLSSADAHV